jgi:hypothetical protein
MQYDLLKNSTKLKFVIKEAICESLETLCGTQFAKRPNRENLERRASYCVLEANG